MLHSNTTFRLLLHPTYRNIVMQIHFPSIVTVFVALLFVSGTAGCQNTGGVWYNPKSYAWTNPFSKSDSSTRENPKPSLDSRSNIVSSHGEYTDNQYANRSGGLSAGTSSDWGRQNPVSPQHPSNVYGDFSNAVPSSYPPPYLVDGGGQPPFGSQGAVPSSPYPSHQNQISYQYQPETTQYQMAQSQYGTSTPNLYHEYSAPQYQHTAGHAPIQSQENIGYNYNPFGVVPPQDPYAAGIKQPPYNMPADYQPGYGNYDQQSTSSPPYSGGGVPGANNYPPFPPPSASGY